MRRPVNWRQQWSSPPPPPSPSISFLQALPDGDARTEALREHGLQASGVVLGGDGLNFDPMEQLPHDPFHR